MDAGMRYRRGMSNPHETPGALKALQDDIYREKVLRARKQTPEQRMADVFELSNFVPRMMLSGAMNKLETTDEALGWQEVRRWMARLDHVREHKFYAVEKPYDT